MTGGGSEGPLTVTATTEKKGQNLRSESKTHMSGTEKLTGGERRC